MKVLHSSFAAALLCVFGLPAHSDFNRSLLDQSLKAWNPKDVTLSEQSLHITLPQRKITPEIYQAVIEAGMCVYEVMGGSLPNVSEVVVLNQFSAQGYVFEQGHAFCDDKRDLPILGMTHWY